MANSLQTSLKSAAAKIAQYVDDASEMQVITNYVEVGADGDTPRLAAKTVVRLDGDSENSVPVQPGADGNLAVDDDLYAVHQENVDAAIEYRARMLGALLSAFRSVLGD